MEALKDSLGVMPANLVADAGYGSEENYEYLENNDIEAYVKFNYFHKEQSRKWQENPAKIENLFYNEQEDCFFCPMGQRMTLIKKTSRKTPNKYQQEKKCYQAQNCSGCPMRGPCHKQKTNRIIEVNPRLARYKQLIREKLNSETGLQYRSQRPVDVEAVFGSVKYNHGFDRFLLRGLEKTNIEAGLISLAHNLRKMAN